MDQELNCGRAGRIAILAHSLNTGGAQLRLVSLANALAKSGRPVDFVSVSDVGAVAQKLSPDVRLALLQSPEYCSAGEDRHPIKDLRGRRALINYLRRERPSVLLAGITNVHAIAVLARRALGKEAPKLVLRASRHPRRSYPWKKLVKKLVEPLRAPFDRRLYDQADLVIAVSKEVGDELRSTMRNPARLVTIGNPIVTEEFTAKLNQPIEHQFFDAGVPVVIGVGRLSTQKNFTTLIAAFKRVLEVRPARLIILGEGKRRGDLEAQIASLGLTETVAMPGHVDDVPAWMRRADVLASSSLWEGSPGVLIEALAAGTPVVATACPGGSIELLADGRGGWLVPLRDPTAMAEAILVALGRPADPEAIRVLAEPYGEVERCAEYEAALDGLFAD